MNGITAAFTGRIGKDAEVRTTKDEKPWASFPVAVDSTCERARGPHGDSVKPRRRFV
jgi:hypothetical protein